MLLDVNEIKKIDDFLDNVGSLMVFMDASARSKQSFSNLDELLYEWGISYGDSVVYDPSNCINVDGTALISNYTEEGNGATLTKSMRTISNVPRTIVNYTMPIYVTYNNGESASIDQGTRDVSSVLTSSEKAYACGFDSNETVDTGTFNLMTLSTEQRYIDNEANYNYVLACGTTDFVSDKYIGSSTYGNVDILYSAMKTMGKITVPNGIEFKIFDNNELNISTSEAYAWTVILSALLPGVTIVTGIVVYIRRRRL